jgi:PAS domain S-box-containing protein
MSDDAFVIRLAELEARIKHLEKENRTLAREGTLSRTAMERSKIYISSKEKLLASLIDEKAKQEKYFHLLLESTQEIMLLLDQNLRFVYCSDMFLSELGIAEFGMISNLEFRNVFSRVVDESSLEKLAEILEKTIRESRSHAEARTMDIGMKGNPRHYTIYINPMLNENGTTEGALVLFQDMTEIMRSKEEAEQANKAKSSFLARMSHEIRTPLNAILGLSEVELQNVLPPRTRVNLGKIYNSGSHLLEIVNDILDVSKIESGNFEIYPAEYEFAGLISDTVQLNIVRVGSKPIRLKLDIDPDIPIGLYGDELRVKQILNNLISNAFKYTEKGEVRLTARWERQGDAALLIFTVADSGKGIKKEDMRNIFSEYTQFDASSNRHIEGTGLGLSITKGLVEMMGGTIMAKSEYLKGSVFRVTLPQGIFDAKPIGKLVVDDLHNFRFSEDRNRSRGNTIIRSHMPYGRILVVDDLEINLDVMRGLLMPYGLTVDTALSGREAVERIKEHAVHYDLVFMDHMMPEMDGVEAVRIIRNEIGGDYARTLPVIVLTASAVAGIREVLLQSGFDDYVSKPIDIKQLDMVLNQWVRDRRNEEALREAENHAADPMPGETGKIDDVGKWLLEHPVEGIDFDAALRLYGNSGAAYMPILQSFAVNTPPLLEQMSTEPESLSGYAVKVHGLKGTCNVICAAAAAAAALELEIAAENGDIELVRARHGALKERVLNITGRLKPLLEAWEAGRPALPREPRAEPDPALLACLSDSTAAYNSSLTGEILAELEQYRYEKGEDLIKWLREQAENFDYDIMHQRLAELLAGKS